MTKRSHGTGGITKRGENSWRLRYYVGDVRHAVTFRGTKKEAEAELRRLLGDADKGAHVAVDKKRTLSVWAGEWIELKAAERQHKTVARYEDLLRLHVLPKLGDRLLQQITPHEINLLYAQMTTLAPRTRHHVATVLKSCIQAAMDSKLIASNPAGGKRPSPGDSEVGQALEQDKIVALVEGFRGTTLFEIVCVLAFTGMRRGEALALRWTDFDVATKTLTIDRALEYTQKYGLQFKVPKSARGRRTIALDDFLAGLLLKEKEKYLRVVAGAPDAADVDLSLVRLPENWLVFPAPGGPFDSPRHPDSVTKQFTKRAEKILGFSIRLHDLRVSHGTWLLDQGKPVHTVAKRLGHDPSVLLKVYAKRTQKSDEATAATIGNMTKGMKI
jgi:integrase